MRKVSRAAWYKELNYTPRLWQQLADEAGDAGQRYLAAFSFPRGGKSWWAARHVEPLILMPNTHGWIVGPTYPLGSKEFGYILTDFAETGWLGKAKSVRNDVRGGNMSIRFPWGSFVEVVSADNPTSLRAEELDWLILAEASALSPEIYHRHLYARTEKRKARVLIPTTPKGYNWIYDVFRTPALKNLPDKEFGPWVGNQRELVGKEPNPRYDPLFWSKIISAVPDFGELLETSVYDADTIERARRTLPAPIFAEQFGGDFASYAGRIYPFDSIEHICDPFKVPDDWTHVVGWDHGADNPTAIMFGSYSPEGILYWWGEIYKSGHSAGEFAGMMRAMMGMKAISALSIDPSAKQVRIELARYGITTNTPADRQIEARIIRMTSLMREHKFKVLRGQCPNFVQELITWEWDDEAPVTKPRPRPRQRCHALDAAGYASLMTVGMPHGELLDPLAPSGEDPNISRFWHSSREQWQRVEDNQKREHYEGTLYEDLFEEVGLRGEDYDPDA